GLLLLFELELAEVHDLADRRIGLRLDLDQVQALILGHRQRFIARQHADHFTVAADHAHARHADFVVATILLGVKGTDIAISGWNRTGPDGASAGAGAGSLLPVFRLQAFDEGL